MRFAQGVHVLNLQSGFGDGIYEHKIEMPGVFGHAVGHVQARVRGFQATDFLLECVAKPFLDGAIEHFAVVNGQVVRHIEAQGGFARFWQSVHHRCEAHRRVADELPVFALKADGFKLHPHQGRGGDHFRVTTGILISVFMRIFMRGGPAAVCVRTFFLRPPEVVGSTWTVLN